MSQARGGQNAGHYYSNITKPYCLNLSWVVAATNGLGITSLKSNGWVNNVFMHTSTTPAANNGMTNPNPANGFALIQLMQNFNYYISSLAGFVSPASGSDVKIDNSAMTAGQPYIITTLGNATLAKWQAIGVPPGVTPAVGVSFVALTNGGAGNTLTSRVQVPSVSGISSIEVVGNPNVSTNSNIASNAGQFVLLQFLGSTVTMGAYTPAGTNSAPAFTGSALGNHAHDLLVKGGQAASTTNDIAAYAGPLLGKEQASDATFAGGSAANGGVQNASAGTPAGSVAAPIFTGSAASLTGTVSYAPAAPAAGSLVSVSLFLDGSSVTIDGL